MRAPDDSLNRDSDARSWQERWKKVRALTPGNQGLAIEAMDGDGKHAFVKVLENRATERRMRMHREVQALLNLNIPGVPRIIESNAHHFADKSYELFLAAEFVDGESLSAAVGADTITPEMALQIVRDICAVLASAHNQRIYHRDIKPDNVVLEAASGRTYLVDFGMAYLEDPNDELATENRIEVGNRFLRLPEFSSGFDRDNKRDRRSDVTFCVGLLFYMLTKFNPTVLQDENGVRPHERPRARTMLLATGCNYERLLSLFDTGFQSDIAKRFQSVEEFIRALNALSEDTPPSPVDSAALLEHVQSQLNRTSRQTQVAVAQEMSRLFENALVVISDVVNKLPGVTMGIRGGKRQNDIVSTDYVLTDSTNARNTFMYSISVSPVGANFLVMVESGDGSGVKARVAAGGQLGDEEAEAIRCFVLTGFGEAISSERFVRPRELEDSPYEPMHTMGDVPDTSPALQIDWFPPRFEHDVVRLSWRLSNRGKSDARDVSVFLPCIAVYAIPTLRASSDIIEDMRFDDRKSYNDFTKPPVQAILEFADVAGNLYRQDARVDAYPAYGGDDADYKTTRFGPPYLVAKRIVELDPDGYDRFLATAPLILPGED